MEGSNPSNRNGYAAQQQRPLTKSSVNSTLEKFLHSSEKDIALPAMDRVSRQRMHEQARRLGLETTSFGVEPNRYVYVCRSAKPKPSFTYYVAPPLISDPIITQEVDNLITDFPITESDIERHTRTEDKSVATFEQGRQWAPRKVPAPGSDAQERTFPVNKHKREIMNKIENNRVVIICGGTGCGKSTQVPQFILEDAHERKTRVSIFCTQPRRLPATSISERIAKERGEPLGKTVGYKIKLESRLSDTTALVFCTSGVLLRMVSTNASAKDITHVILDEVHEREANTDFLLIALRNALHQNPHLKLILMSATVEANLDLFQNYFNGFPVGISTIRSKLHEVHKFHLDEVLAMIRYKFPPKQPGFGMNTFNALPTTFGPSNPTCNTWNNNVYEQSAAPTWYDQAQSVVATQTAFGYENNVSTMTNQWPDGMVGSSNSAPTWYGQGQTGTSTAQPAARDWNDPWYEDNFGHGPQEDVWPPPAAMAPSQTDAWYDAPGVSGYTAPQQLARNHSDEQLYEWCQEVGVDYASTRQEIKSSSPQEPELQHQQLYQNPPPQYHSEPVVRPAFGHQQHQRVPHLRHQNSSDPFANPIPSAPEYFDPSVIPAVRNFDANAFCLAKQYEDRNMWQPETDVDVDLIFQVVMYCAGSSIKGSVLVFLPGYDSIAQVAEKLENVYTGNNERVKVIMLHSQLTTAEQNLAFVPAEQGERKVILSTNIAEVSLTIEDVVFVVDTGKVKEKNYDHEMKYSELRVVDIAKSNADQRAGRSGRVQTGYCFRLYTEEKYQDMLDIQIPELKRTAIHEVCLHAKMLAPPDMKVVDFLSQAPEPPQRDVVAESLRFLQKLGALAAPVGDDQAEPYLTSLGKVLSQLPLDPQLARLLLMGLATKCLYPIVTLVAALTYKDPFLIPPKGEREKMKHRLEQIGKQEYSDHLLLIRLIDEFSQARPSYYRNLCQMNYLNPASMTMILKVRSHLMSELLRSELIEDVDCMKHASFNVNSSCWPVVRAVIVFGCYPYVGMGNTPNLNKCTSHAGKVEISQHSNVRRLIMKNKKKNDVLKMQYFAFNELYKSNGALMMKTMTMSTALPVLLFCGEIRIEPRIIEDLRLCQYPGNTQAGFNTTQKEVQQTVMVDEWLSVSAPIQVLREVFQLKFKVMEYFLHGLATPYFFSRNTSSPLLKTIQHVLQRDHDLNQLDHWDMPHMIFDTFELKKIEKPRVTPPLVPVRESTSRNSVKSFGQRNDYNQRYQSRNYNGNERAECDENRSNGSKSSSQRRYQDNSGRGYEEKSRNRTYSRSNYQNTQTRNYEENGSNGSRARYDSGNNRYSREGSSQNGSNHNYENSSSSSQQVRYGSGYQQRSNGNNRAMNSRSREYPDHPTETPQRQEYESYAKQRNSYYQVGNDQQQQQQLNPGYQQQSSNRGFYDNRLGTSDNRRINNEYYHQRGNGNNRRKGDF